MMKKSINREKSMIPNKQKQTRSPNYRFKDKHKITNNNNNSYNNNCSNNNNQNNKMNYCKISFKLIFINKSRKKGELAKIERENTKTCEITKSNITSLLAEK